MNAILTIIIDNEACSGRNINISTFSLFTSLRHSHNASLLVRCGGIKAHKICNQRYTFALTVDIVEKVNKSK